MNVQSANFLSLLSGVDNVGNLQQGLLGADTGGGFAAALMLQLKLLGGDMAGDAKVEAPNMAMLQDWVDAAKNGAMPQELQHVAALLGKDLPPAAKNSQDIDLEDTLQTLAGVLQQLQQLESDASANDGENLGVTGKRISPAAEQAADIVAEVTTLLAMSNDVGVVESSPEIMFDDLAVAEAKLAVMSDDLAVGESNPEIMSDDWAVDESNSEIMSDDSDVGESSPAISSANPGVVEPNPAAKSNDVSVLESNVLTNQSETEAEQAFLLLNAKKTPSVSSREVANPNVQTEGANANGGDLGLEFNQGVTAMMGREGAEGKSQQERPNSNLKTGSLLDQVESGRDEAGNSKSLPEVAADIAKLNQTVRADRSAASADQSAMLKHYNDPGWNKELGEKLIWMHKQAIPSAELRLNPEHLGPVLVKIDVSHDQTSVAFTAQNQAVKEAIEAAIPKLREMLSGQQLNLADVNVSQQQSDQRQTPRDFFRMASDQQRNPRGDFDGNAPANEAQNLVDEIEAGRAVASNGLLSLFA
ncbi:MAG: flagellar hook-length control protein FliK [Methylomonas sp.]|nr:flagellar hook-length control protein FliK [Methylomonas sp.]